MCLIPLSINIKLFPAFGFPRSTGGLLTKITLDYLMTSGIWPHVPQS